MKLSAFGISDIGLVRTNNEDSFCFDQSMQIFILADGMGGHNAGEIASAKAVETIFNHFSVAKHNKDKYTNNLKKDYKKDLSFIENVIGLSILESNQNIYIESLSNTEVSGMGTTLELLTFHEGNYYVGHIGDSRVYQLRNNKLKQITEDHSVVNLLINQKILTKEDARYHPYSHILTNALGVQSEITFDILSNDYQKDDLYLLCSDGLSDMISDATIETILAKNDKTLTEKANLLVDSAKYNSGVDNITLIIVQVVE